jgi:hypothetical protein
MTDSSSEITPQILKAIDVLEGLEDLLDLSPSDEIEAILQEAWIKVTDTFPEDFKDATAEDASAEGLRRYIRVKAFFSNPTEHSISRLDLELYYRNHALSIDEDSPDFFLPD